jgi:hypothetical protein
MRRVRSHQASATGRMHLGTRSAAVLALATAGALAVAGVALASASSTVTLNFAPGNLSATTFQSGKITVHTHTDYTNPGNSNPGGATLRAQLYFEDDFRVNPSATPLCTPTGGDLANAIAQCGGSKIGAGTAQGSANGVFTINGCVLAFNGKKDAAGDNTVVLFTRMNVRNPSTMTCGSPATNHQGNNTVILKGILTNNTTVGGADLIGGEQVDFNNITSAAAYPLTDFNVNIQKGNFIQARCQDMFHRLNLQTKFTYNDATTQTVNAFTACTVG